jgi:endo-beta-N-acetylglucosaminidase D
VRPDKFQSVLLRLVVASFCFCAIHSFAASPGQPFASYWHPNTLLTWNPTNDADAAFNRANTPLATRYSHPALNVNAHAKTNQGKVVSLSAFAPTSGNPSQGTLSMNYFAHNYWQYEDIVVFWGGSAGEGIILAPNATVIDAAHRNGVAVLGNIFFPPTAYGGQFQWVNDFLQKSGSTFPVADKLIQVAQYYGFDGWFINQETAGGSATTATTMRDFIRYMRTNSTLQVQWYDAMIETGSVTWQNQLNSLNDMFFHETSGGRVSDSMFLNFNWSSAGLTSSRTLAQSYGRNQYDVYAGVDVEGGGYNASVNWGGVFPEGSAHTLSLGFYRPDWCYNYASGPTDFYARENRFWVGPFGDPSNTSSTNAWAGIAHYIAAKTPVTKLPFVTSFNTGQGSRYAIGGQTLMTGNWNNLSVQDVLPTWRWLVQSSGTKLTPSLDWADAYYGGTSLKLTGTIDSTNTILLYQANLAVSNNTQLGITYKIGTASAPTYMKLAVAFEDAPTTYTLFDVANTTNAGWNTQTFNLSSFAGKKIAVIALRFGASSVVSGYTMRIGQLAVWNGAISTPAPPSAIIVDRVSAVDATTATARLKWTHSPSAIAHYNVYRRNADNSRTWLGATPNNAYFVPQVKRVAGETYVPIEIETVAPDYGVSTAATTNLFWPVMLVSTGSVWKYNDSGANLGTAWRATNYDDSAWSSGTAMLGYGDANGINPTTTNSYGADANNKYITTYYRRAFVLTEDPLSYKALTLNLQRDDGAVVYLNGVEVFRSNMPGGAVNYLTLASGSVSGGDESAFFSTNLPNSTLVAGTNIFAVEIHQNTNNSSDIAFDLSFSGELNAAPIVAITSPANGHVLATNRLGVSVAASDLDGTMSRVELFVNGQLLGLSSNAPYQFTWTNIPIGFHLLTARATDNAGRMATSAVVNVTLPGIATTPVTLIATGAVWRYFDQTNDLGESWRSNSFNDASWLTGASELGFGDVADGRPETTVISNRLQLTFYFRRAFYIAEPTLISSFTARLLRDDGAVIYLNGAEVWRDNMPGGVITNGTPAVNAINTAAETTWLTNALPRSALIRGTNILAAEIHQQSSASSDVSFNFDLNGNVIIPVQPKLEFSLNGNATFTWPEDQGTLALYATTNLTTPNWVRVTNSPTLVNGMWRVTLPQTNLSSQFFQLRYP